MKNRCCNLDWLEVCCLENAETFPMDAQFFNRRQYITDVREYGTSVYAEMFTICQGDEPLFEVRRAPYSTIDRGGLFDRRMCHIRVVNKQLYREDAVQHLRRFLLLHGYTLKNITRVDIALDFNSFDSGVDPQRFVDKYMRGELGKLHVNRLHSHAYEVEPDPEPQGNKNPHRIKKEPPYLMVHGRDAWSGRIWNSLKWGSESSAVSTKLYNKSMELARIGHDKPYIRKAWAYSGLDVSKPVWRIEFAIKTDVKEFVPVGDGKRTLHIDLGLFDSPDKLLNVFHVLSYRYFHFVKKVYTSEGNLQRKDRCPRYHLFYYRADQKNYVPQRPSAEVALNRTNKMLLRRLLKVMEDVDNRSFVTREAAAWMAREIIQDMRLEEDCYTYLKRLYPEWTLPRLEFDNFIDGIRLTADRSALMDRLVSNLSPKSWGKEPEELGRRWVDFFGEDGHWL